MTRDEIALRFAIQFTSMPDEYAYFGNENQTALDAFRMADAFIAESKESARRRGIDISESPPQGEASEVEVLRALDRSATRKRLDLEAEILAVKAERDSWRRVAERLQEWINLLRMIAREYSGNMKLSKALDRADEAIDAAREAEGES